MAFGTIAVVEGKSRESELGDRLMQKDCGRVTDRPQGCCPRGRAMSPNASPPLAGGAA
jgi:hypothetical protein